MSLVTQGETETMRGHPANLPTRVEDAAEARAVYGAALLAAVEHGAGALVECAHVTALGQRTRETETRNGSRTYTLDGFEVRTDGAEPRALYILAGGVSAARTVLDSDGVPIAHAERTGRGLSPEFREWIARSVEADRARRTGGDSD